MAGSTDVILLSGALITVTTVIRNTTDKKFHFSPIMFGFLLTAALLILSAAAPTVAKGLAVMGVVGAFVANGPAVFKVLGGLK
jgi:hypothetical protein